MNLTVVRIARAKTRTHQLRSADLQAYHVVRAPETKFSRPLGAAECVEAQAFLCELYVSAEPHSDPATPDQPPISNAYTGL